MKKTMKQRIIAIFCVICMVVSVFYVQEPMKTEAETKEAAAGEDVVMLDAAPESNFAVWSFSDMGIEDNANVADHINWNQAAGTDSLHQSIFKGKIYFSKAGSGSLYFGGTKERGFVLKHDAASGLKLGLATASEPYKTIQVFHENVANTAITGNHDLELAVSFEKIGTESNGLATVKIGVFFDRVLYDNQYIEVKNVPVSLLTRNMRWRQEKKEVLLSESEEANYEKLTFSDFQADGVAMDATGKICDKTATGDSIYAADAGTLDGVLFQGKFNFPKQSATGKRFGVFSIGHSSDLKYGILIRQEVTDGKLYFGERFINKGDIALEGTANLLDNPDLEVAISVKYVATSDNTKVNLKVGLWLDGVLYNNQYITIAGVAKTDLSRKIRVTDSDTANDVGIQSIGYKKISLWDFKDMANKQLSETGTLFAAAKTGHAEYNTGESYMNGVLLEGKFNFPRKAEGVATRFGVLYFGGAETKQGIIIMQDNVAGSHNLITGYRFSGIANADQPLADETLLDNPNLKLGISIAYQNYNATAGTVSLKVGIFFDDVLKREMKIEGVKISQLSQTIWADDSNTNNCVEYQSVGDAAPKPIGILLSESEEANYEKLTFSDFKDKNSDVAMDTTGKICDKTTAGHSIYAATAGTLDGILLQGKFNFPTQSATGKRFGVFSIGHSSDSTYGILIRQEVTDGKLYFGHRFTTGAGKYDIVLEDTNLLDNPDLEVAISVKYEATSDDTKVNLKVGLWLDGVLYNNQYITIAGVAKTNLARKIRVTDDDTANHVEIQSVKYDRLTFSDFLNADHVRMDKSGKILDTTTPSGPFSTGNTNMNGVFFQGKFNFPTQSATGKRFGVIYIGGAKNSNGVVVLQNSSTGSIDVGTRWDTGKYGSKTPDYSLTGNNLFNNGDLELGISVKYQNYDASTKKTDLEIGFWLNGELITTQSVEEVDANLLSQRIQLVDSDTAEGTHVGIQSMDINAFASVKEDITLFNAPEKDFTTWTFADLGVADQTIAGGTHDKINWDNMVETKTLDKTLFQGKIYFPTVEKTANSFYIGGEGYIKEELEEGATEPSQYRGFLMRTVWRTNVTPAENHLVFDFQIGDKEMIPRIAEFTPEKAGVKFCNNDDLEIALSVEYVETNGTDTTIKVGVFFNKKLYDNTYYTITVPTNLLTRNARVIYGEAGLAVASTGNETDLVKGQKVARETQSHISSVSALQTEVMSKEYAFDGVYNVDSIRLYNNKQKDSIPVDFIVEAYTENGWKKVADYTEYSSQLGWNDITFADVACSAIRVKATKLGELAATKKYGLAWSNIVINGAPAVADVEAPYAIAENAVIFGLKDNPAAATKQLIFEQGVKVRGISLYTAESSTCPEAFEVLAYNGSEWVSALKVSGYDGGEANLHEFAFATPNECSSIRIVFEGEAPKLEEIRVDASYIGDKVALFGDGNKDHILEENSDGKELRKALVGTSTADADFNCDTREDPCDLIRMKQYFAQRDSKKRTYDITTMSYNILGTAMEGYAAPKDRMQGIADYIVGANVDLIGIQEACHYTSHGQQDTNYDWQTNLVNEVCKSGTYQAIKMADEKGFKSDTLRGKVAVGQGLIIFYKKDRFALGEHGMQQYSTDEKQARFFQWAELTDNRTGKKVLMTNTHWSINADSSGNASPEAGQQYRQTQARELLAFWNNKNPELLIATGDYNSQFTETENVFNTTYKAAQSLTEHGFAITKVIDHVYMNTASMKMKNVFIDKSVPENSDHSPYRVKVSYDMSK